MGRCCRVQQPQFAPSPPLLSSSINASRPPVPSTERPSSALLVLFTSNISPGDLRRYQGARSPLSTLLRVPCHCSLQLEGESESAREHGSPVACLSTPSASSPGRTSRHLVSCEFVASSSLLHPLPSRWEPFFHSDSCGYPVESESPIFAVALPTWLFRYRPLSNSLRDFFRARSFDPTGSADSM